MNSKTLVYGVEITNPDKKINGDIKKIDVIEYYKEIADYILPFIYNRPISEIRCHKGFEDCFYKKHPDKTETLLKIENKKDLILEVQLGAIEIHPYCYKEDEEDFPDTMIFDIDPDESMPHKTLCDNVMLLKKILDDLNLISFVKTSGGKGYHIVVPFSKVDSFEEFESFAKNIALLLEKMYPDIFTSNIRKSSRHGKIFVDYLRNKKGATCVAPFSLRAKKGLTVSLPIKWEDIYRIKPNEVNIKNFAKYFDKFAWKNYFKIKQELK